MTRGLACCINPQPGGPGDFWSRFSSSSSWYASIKLQGSSASFGPPRVFYFPGTLHIWWAFPYPPTGEAPDGRQFVKWAQEGVETLYSLLNNNNNRTWVYSTDFWKKFSKICPVRAQLFHADRRTDRQTWRRLIFPFRNFSNARDLSQKSNMKSWSPPPRVAVTPPHFYSGVACFESCQCHRLS